MTAVLDTALDGQKVRITHKKEDLESPFDGKVEAISPAGVLVKVKGKSSAQLILAHEVEAIEPLADPTNLEQSVLVPVKKANVKRHLVSAHGWLLTQVNPLTDDEALVQHEALHTGEYTDVLGHRHEDKKRPTATEAAADPEAASEGDE